MAQEAKLQLAARADIDSSYISHIERGDRNLTVVDAGHVALEFP
jgi:transcriptional regulator with XRE-family HTH domain